MLLKKQAQQEQISYFKLNNSQLLALLKQLKLSDAKLNKLCLWLSMYKEQIK